MKHTLYILAAAALFAACSENPEPVADDYGVGTARIAVATSAAVEAATRSDKAELPAGLLPTAADFSLHITGTYEDQNGPQVFDQSWDSFTDLKKLTAVRGDYTASVACGDPEAEGPALPCFSGEAAFKVLARQDVEAQVTAAMTNSAFRIAFGEWFTSYYSQVRIVIRTESGFERSYTGSDDELIFAKPATKLYMRGTAVKSQTGAEVEFPETQIGQTAARTFHTITITASQAGAAGLEIRLDDTFTTVKEKLVELNDDADPVE